MEMLKISKIVVYAGFIVPAAFIFLKLYEKDYSTWIPIAVAGIALYMFNDNFIDKADVRVSNAPSPGPQEPYMPPSAEQWQYNLDETGEYVPKKTFQPPTRQKFNQPPQFNQYGGR